MAITPQTDLFLIRCPIEIDNRNQLNFSNSTAQYNYFYGLPKIGVDNFSYQRKDNTIRYPAHIDNIRNYNYCMYRNDNYSNKWFYAFIEGMEYLNDNTTLIKIKTDVWQTWQFDLTFRRSFVLREHTNNDAIGENTIPEGLEYGEYIVNHKSTTTFSTNDCVLAAQVSQLPKEMNNLRKRKRIYNGLPNGCWILLFPLDDYANFDGFVRTYDSQNLANAIVSVGLVPKTIVDFDNSLQLSYDFEQYGFDLWLANPSYSALHLQTYRWDRNNTIDGYIPRNNKLFCSPYNYLMVTNNAGSSVCYAWEEFSNKTNAYFDIKGAFSQGCDIKAIPNNYKKTDMDGGYQWSVSLNKLPMVSWNSNFYLNWAAVNSKYMQVQAGLTAANWGANMITGMLTGNIGGMISGTMNLASGVADMMQQVRQAEMVPNSAKGNQNTGDLNWVLGKTSFTGYKMSIKAEYARQIDDYFSAFGYKTNRNKIPNITGRSNWNYVQTAGCNIIANIPQDDLDEIKSLFDNGITIWHKPNYFLDYSQSNNIV